jgi:hypothetical protein
VHVGLLAWAIAGLAELFLPAVPWRRISNPLFSPRMLLLQWSLVSLAAISFLAGYFLRWRHTAVLMTVFYGLMALVCAYQTFYILTAPTRFRAMASEYAEYALILAFLFLSPYMRARFA